MIDRKGPNGLHLRWLAPAALLLLAMVLPAEQPSVAATTRFGAVAQQATASCSVDAATLTARGCSVLRQDTAAAVDPEPGRWGNVTCASRSRYRYVTRGGDQHPRASGVLQRNTAYRRLTVIDGDDVAGERCQLGRNEWRFGQNLGTQTSGTFALYGEGRQRITFFSLRQRAGFNPYIHAWQQIAQMKQAQPYEAAIPDGNAVELQIYRGRLWLTTFWAATWSTIAPANDIWVRYALDVVYSTDAARGMVRLYVDLNGDGDALDRGERSPTMNTRTLATDPASDQPIPDVLMLGIYHNPAIDCPAPVGCSIDVDNVQVVG